MKHEKTPENNLIPRHKDIAGQLDLGGAYAKMPDEACAKNAKPLEKPERKPPSKPFKWKRRIFNLVNGRFTGLPANQFEELP